MSGSLDLTNQYIQETYQRVVQTESGSLYDGIGNPVDLLFLTASAAITASYADYAVSASHEIIKEVSSSFADTASYVNPLVQNVLVTGSITNTGGINAGGTIITDSEASFRTNGITNISYSRLGIFQFSSWQTGTTYAQINGWNQQSYINSPLNIGLASTTMPARLRVRGSGTTSSTTTLLIENANASASMVVLDNGTTQIITPEYATNHLILKTNGGDSVLTFGGSYGAGYGRIQSVASSLNIYSAARIVLYNGDVNNNSILGVPYNGAGLVSPYTRIALGGTNSVGDFNIINGKIGIGGVNNPTTTLDVSGSGNFTDGLTVTGSGDIVQVAGANPFIRIDDTSAASRSQLYGGLEIYDSTGALGSYFKHVSSANLEIRSTAGDVSIGTFADGGLIYLDGDKVGISTSSPAAKLHVKGLGTTSSTTTLLVQNNTLTELLKIRDDGFVSIAGATQYSNYKLGVVGGIDSTSLRIGQTIFSYSNQFVLNASFNYGGVFSTYNGNQQTLSGFTFTGPQSTSVVKNNYTWEFFRINPTWIIPSGSTDSYANGFQVGGTQTLTNTTNVTYRSIYVDTTVVSGSHTALQTTSGDIKFQGDSNVEITGSLLVSGSSTGLRVGNTDRAELSPTSSVNLAVYSDTQGIPGRITVGSFAGGGPNLNGVLSFANLNLTGFYGSGSFEQAKIESYYAPAGSTGGDLRFYTRTFNSFTENMRIGYNGNVLIGTTTDAGYKLDVNGSVRAQGGVYVSEGQRIEWAAGREYLIGNGGRATMTLNQGGNALAYSLSIVASGFSQTSGTGGVLSYAPTINPTSGTAVFNLTNIAPTINQTGGANGITRGLYVNPTLTAAADFRAIETTAGNVVFNGGNVGIGTTTPSYKLDIDASGSSNVFRLKNTDGTNNPELQITATSEGILYNNQWSANAISHIFKTFGTERLRINAYGIGIGLTANASAKLQVKGSGTTSSTTALLIQNANASASLVVTDNRQVQVSSTTVSNPGYSFIDNPDTGLYLFGGQMGTVVDGQYSILYGSAGPSLYSNTTNSITAANLLMTKIGSNHRMSIWMNGNNDFQFEAWQSGVGYANNIILQSFDGNVGIGTTSPGKKLTVFSDNGTADNPVAQFVGGGSNYDETTILFGGTASFAKVGYNVGAGGPGNYGFLALNSSKVLSWHDTGNVLIGTTTDAGYKLDVSGSARFTDGIIVTGSSVINGNVTIYGTASVDVLITNYESSSIIYSSGSTKFGDSMDDTHEFTGSLSVTGSSVLDGGLTVTGSLNLAASGLSGTATNPFKIQGGGGAIRIDATNTVYRAYSYNLQINSSYDSAGSSALFVSYSYGGTLPRVGIGSTAPSARLHVKGAGATSATTALLVENSNASASMVVKDDGNVGIGTSSPSSLLTINSAATLATGITFDNAGSKGYLFGDGLAMSLRAGSTYGITISPGSAGLYAFNSSGNFFINLQAPTTIPHYAFYGDADTGMGRPTADTLTLFAGGERMRIASTGNVLINTTTDTGYKLDVNGSIMGDTYYVGNASNYIDVATGLRLRGDTNGIRFMPGGSESTRMLANGNVGIGTTTPSASLHVSGSTLLYKSGSTVLDVQGSQGQLFSVVDELSGSLMSVNDISGLPILEVFSDDRVEMGTYGAPGLVVSGSAVTVATASAAPTDTPSEGTFKFATVGGSYYIYAYLGGAWRSGSLS